ncbi:MAG: hypothetical protein WCJ39_01515 [bacterium]
MIDVEGPGIRTGVRTQPITYKKGDVFPIYVTDKLSDERALSCDYQ